MRYIDLAPTIKHDRTRGPITGLDGESYALKWLDDHPDQAPDVASERTATEKEFEQAIAEVRELSLRDRYRELLSRFGVTIVPDPEPEPTNLQLLTQAIRDWEEGRGIDRILARHLDALGVKAPGGES